MSSSIRLSVLLSSVILFFSCSTKTEQNEDSSSLYDSTAAVPQDQEDIGLTGDFDGDGTVENVLMRVLNSNPDEPFSYSIEFSNPKLTPIEISPMIADGYMILNEGDIDGKSGDELSIVVCNMDNAASLNLYTFNGKDWNEIAESVNVVCAIPDKIELTDVLTKTDSGVYAMEFEVLSYDSVIFQKKAVILSSARGDFDGNGESENVYIKQIHGAPVDDEGYWEYSIVFSDTNLPVLTIENNEAEGCMVSNKGNTDGKPGDELSVIQNRMMSQMVDEAFGFDGKKWKKLSTEVTKR